MEGRLDGVTEDALGITKISDWSRRRNGGEYPSKVVAVIRGFELHETEGGEGGNGVFGVLRWISLVDGTGLAIDRNARGWERLVGLVLLRR